MTVIELISRIMNAYPGATQDALKSFTPVFYARLKRHEGPGLETAANEVLGTFKPRFDQKFPIPVDFEAHLPSGKIKLPDDAPLDWEGHKRRKRELIGTWEHGQGSRIREHRGQFVWTHCWLHAKQQAHDRAWSDDPKPIALTAGEIELCGSQVVSTARITAFGARTLHHGSNDAWDDQMAECRSILRKGKFPEPMTSPGEIATPISDRIKNRLAQLAAAHRQGKSPPPPEDPA